MHGAGGAQSALHQMKLLDRRLAEARAAGWGTRFLQPNQFRLQRVQTLRRFKTSQGQVRAKLPRLAFASERRQPPVDFIGELFEDGVRMDACPEYLRPAGVGKKPQPRNSSSTAAGIDIW